MANRSTKPVQSLRDNVVMVHDKLVGNGTNDPTLPNASRFAKFVMTATRTGTGTFSLTFKNSFPELLDPDAKLVGTTAGLKARFSAIDVKAKTATLVTEVGAVATDPATTDTIYLNLTVRNSGRN